MTPHAVVSAWEPHLIEGMMMHAVINYADDEVAMMVNKL
jgi:hypothetical protein